MSFEIKESLLLGKQNDPLLCEDSIYTNANFAAVVDGATSKTNFLFDNKTPGKIASQLVVQAISKFERETTAENAVLLINKEIYAFYKDNNLVDMMKNNKLNRFNACAAIYSDYNKEIWLIGDCQCIANKINHNNEKKIDSILAEVRSLYLNMLMKDGALVSDLLSNDLGRDYIIPLLKKQNYFQNTDDTSEYSYGLFDGFQLNFADVIKVKSNDNEIILATDGYPKLLNNLIDCEIYLKNVLVNDPLCISMYKSTKGVVGDNLSYDDRAFIKIIAD
ncbi:MAG: hypothetical protein ACRYG7_46175 [Janthinobacterium lividum]